MMMKMSMSMKDAGVKEAEPGGGGRGRGLGPSVIDGSVVGVVLLFGFIFFGGGAVAFLRFVVVLPWFFFLKKIAFLQFSFEFPLLTE